MSRSFILLLPLIAGCSSPDPTASEVVRPVKTLVVAAGDESQLRTFPGVVEASRRVELAFQVPGLLTKFPVKEGQRVAEGEVIAQLRTDEFQARLTSLQGQLDQARAALTGLRAGERPEEVARREAQVRATEARMANAKAALDRTTRLLPGGVATRAEFERDETAYRVAQEEHQAAVQLVEKGRIGRDEDIEAQEAAVRGLEGRVVEANLQLQDTTLRAPYDGVIAQRFVEEGQNVQAKAPVARFQDVDEIEIAVDVPETVMAEIQLSDIEHMTAELSAAAGVRFPVRLREVEQVADPVTQTFNVRVALEAPKNIRVLPGMSARVSVVYHRASILGKRILIPVTAVSESPSGEQVAWVLHAEGHVSPRQVKLGPAAGGQIAVLDGLAAGDRVVVAGVRFLRDGMKVHDLGDALGGVSP